MHRLFWEMFYSYQNVVNKPCIFRTCGPNGKVQFRNKEAVWMKKYTLHNIQKLNMSKFYITVLIFQQVKCHSQTFNILAKILIHFKKIHVLTESEI